MKKILSFLFAVMILLGSIIFLHTEGTETAMAETPVLNVYNWGQYISDGSEGTLNVNKEFEKYYEETFGQKIRVNYTTFASNEDMYNKIKSGAAVYDVIIPSDYMIARMIKEDMLAELNFDNIPNYKNIDEQYKGMYFDPDEKYSIPYNCGTVCVIYNNTMVDEEDIGSWDLLYNEKYKGKILQFNNPRDAFGTMMYAAGIDVNTTDKSEWDTALEMLIQQKPLVQSYVMDEIFNKMKNGSAAIAAYYSGDYLTMYADNEYLSCFYPEEGSNIYVDSMCIPQNASQKEIAERYIDFMLSEEIAIANAEYICYTSPNILVTQNEEYIECMCEMHEDAMEILYPEDTNGFTYYENLDDELLTYMNELWESLKIENSVRPWVYILSGSIAAAVFALLIFLFVRKKYRQKYYYHVSKQM